jgi:hypothetical protein
LINKLDEDDGVSFIDIFGENVDLKNQKKYFFIVGGICFLFLAYLMFIFIRNNGRRKIELSTDLKDTIITLKNIKIEENEILNINQELNVQ